MIIQHDGIRPVAYQQRCQRQTQQSDGAQHQIGAAPSMMLNRPLRERRDED